MKSEVDVLLTKMSNKKNFTDDDIIEIVKTISVDISTPSFIKNLLNDSRFLTISTIISKNSRYIDNFKETEHFHKLIKQACEKKII